MLERSTIKSNLVKSRKRLDLETDGLVAQSWRFSNSRNFTYFKFK